MSTRAPLGWRVKKPGERRAASRMATIAAMKRAHMGCAAVLEVVVPLMNANASQHRSGDVEEQRDGEHHPAAQHAALALPCRDLGVCGTHDSHLRRGGRAGKPQLARSMRGRTLRAIPM